ncbi:hypothetical protein B0G80_4932 [Paraburkholderia sp. BL6669N2]|nr:hypothetical protein B0G80_4932 [Paraburkholderia sp. BL6669N2]
MRSSHLNGGVSGKSRRWARCTYSMHMAHLALHHGEGARAGPFKHVHREHVARIRQVPRASLDRWASGNGVARQCRVVPSQGTRLLFRRAPTDRRQPGGWTPLEAADVEQPVEQRRGNFLGLADRAVGEWPEKRSPVGWPGRTPGLRIAHGPRLQEPDVCRKLIQSPNSRLACQSAAHTKTGPPLRCGTDNGCRGEAAAAHRLGRELAAHDFLVRQAKWEDRTLARFTTGRVATGVTAAAGANWSTPVVARLRPLAACSLHRNNGLHAICRREPVCAGQQSTAHPVVLLQAWRSGAARAIHTEGGQDVRPWWELGAVMAADGQNPSVYARSRPRSTAPPLTARAGSPDPRRNPRHRPVRRRFPEDGRAIPGKRSPRSPRV